MNGTCRSLNAEIVFFKSPVFILGFEVGALKSDGESNTAKCDEVKQTLRIGLDVDDTSVLRAATERL